MMTWYLVLNIQVNDIRGDLNRGHDNCILVSPEMEAEAQYSKNGIGCLQPQ